MKRSVKAETKRGAKRDLFAELSEGMEALADARHGKRAAGEVKCTGKGSGARWRYDR